MKPMF
jgi:hypothetical protein